MGSEGLSSKAICLVFFLYHAGVLLGLLFTLKMGVTCSSKTSTGFQLTMQHYIPEDRTLHESQLQMHKRNYFYGTYSADLGHSLWTEENKSLVFSKTFVKVPAF
jgi:hypothetical protein